MNTDLHSREYKLLLDSRQFPRELTQDAANDFVYKLKDKLKPYGKLSAAIRGNFSEPEVRTTQFWDVPNCALTAGDYALRTRRGVGKTKSKITLKRRKADYFVVQASLGAFDEGEVKAFKPKFEEDIAPFEIKPKGANLAIVLPAEHSIRSRYSLSMTCRSEVPKSPVTSDVDSWFPFVRKIFDVELPAPAKPLIAGPVIAETIAEGLKLDLGDGIVADFTLTLWSFAEDRESPKIAEISFKYDLKQGHVSGKAAQVAYDFFTALQSRLNINMSDASKTSLALPGRCSCY